jgi:hypothetical protein
MVPPSGGRRGLRGRSRKKLGEEGGEKRQREKGEGRKEEGGRRKEGGGRRKEG